MALRVSTTGIDVALDDLGILIVHPTSNLDLTEQFTAIEIRDSEDLVAAIAAGSLDLDDGSNFIHKDDYDPDEVLIQELGITDDNHHVSRDELNSKGDIEITSGVFPLAVGSTASVTRNIYVPLARFITWKVAVDDVVTIVSGPAAGTYTVESITDQQNLIVVESIANGTSGNITIFHPPIFKKIGIDSSALTNITGDTLEETLQSIDAALSASQGLDFNRMILETDGSLVYIGDGDITITTTPLPAPVVD